MKSFLLVLIFHQHIGFVDIKAIIIIIIYSHSKNLKTNAAIKNIHL